MSAPELASAVLDAGLIQFGSFDQDGIQAPYWLRFDMLPSYPAVLNAAAEAVAALIDMPGLDRLVCTQDAVALAVLISQTLDIPLVIHSGTLGTPTRNLIGAYDIGHPSVLISVTTAFPAGFIARLTADAAGVGLNIGQWVSLLEIAPQNELRHAAAVSLRGMAERMAEQGELSATMAARIGG